MTDQSLPITDIQPRPRDRAVHSVFQTQKNVLCALILHDMKARFFGNIWGYVFTIVWPVSHLAILIAVHSLNLTPAYGDSIVLYAATGVMPFIAWNYVARFCMNAQTANRSLLNYPIINPIDLIMSKLGLEMVNTFIVLLALCIFMLIIDIDIMPRDLGQAVLGFLSSLYLGIGFGILCSVIAVWFPFINLVWLLFVITAHLFSGIAIPVETMPQELQRYVAYNPLLHSVEWVRGSYWNDYPTHLLSKTYVLYFATIVTVAGLALERLLRRHRGARGAV